MTSASTYGTKMSSRSAAAPAHRAVEQQRDADGERALDEQGQDRMMKLLPIARMNSGLPNARS